jgi:hypothetical protein
LHCCRACRPALEFNAFPHRHTVTASPTPPEFNAFPHRHSVAGLGGRHPEFKTFPPRHTVKANGPNGPGTGPKNMHCARNRKAPATNQC